MNKQNLINKGFTVLFYTAKSKQTFLHLRASYGHLKTHLLIPDLPYLHFYTFFKVRLLRVYRKKIYVPAEMDDGWKKVLEMPGGEGWARAGVGGGGPVGRGGKASFSPSSSFSMSGEGSSLFCPKACNCPATCTYTYTKLIFDNIHRNINVGNPCKKMFKRFV